MIHDSKKKINLAIFASGGGSNALQIIRHFQDHPKIQISLILFNNKSAGVQKYGLEFNIPAIFWNKLNTLDERATMSMLSYYKVDGIILAGFLALLPIYLIKNFQNKILNIHPALLPDFGGQGMYGRYVHEAVSASGKAFSGITIHLVNEDYDKGRILFQNSIPVLPHEDPTSIQKKVLALEHLHYAKVIEKYFTDTDL